MQTTKKTPSLIFILVGAVLAGYLGYLINGAWTEGIAFNEFMDRFNEACAVPFANYYNSNTVKAVAIALGIYAMAIVMYYTSQRNYMPGKEFGTARFENPKQVNKILADKDENFNRILSQNVKMSLDFRRLKLNGNILICGGSGAGKTFYEVKPNLMQMPHNCSFICTDPKGEILRSCGQMLKNNGYNLKVINLLEMDKSDCYNPFSYIREETDVVKLITNLISNTTPKGATPSDPFWEKAEGLFLQAIFYYVWLEVQPAKRNFETVLKLLGEAEVTEQGKASKLDVRMKFLEESSPLGANHPAVTFNSQLGIIPAGLFFYQKGDKQHEKRTDYYDKQQSDGGERHEEQIHSLKKEIRSGIIRSTYGSNAYEHYLFCSRYRYFRSNTAT